jgi:Zn-dependent oligopeptidase
MSVDTTDNSSQIKADMQPKLGLFLRAMLDDIDKTADPKTPQKTGDLRNLKQKQVLGLNATITWDRSYAAVQETTQFKNYTTPGTGPHFAEDAVREVVGRADEHLREVGL